MREPRYYAELLFERDWLPKAHGKPSMGLPINLSRGKMVEMGWSGFSGLGVDQSTISLPVTPSPSVLQKAISFLKSNIVVLGIMGASIYAFYRMQK